MRIMILQARWDRQTGEFMTLHLQLCRDAMSMSVSRLEGGGGGGFKGAGGGGGGL